jgi:hypothetical protein
MNMITNLINLDVSYYYITTKNKKLFLFSIFKIYLFL